MQLTVRFCNTTDVWQRPVWQLAKLTSHFLSVDSHQLAGTNCTIWRQKMASFWSCQWKMVICPGQMTICQGQVSRRTQPSLSVADSRWLIDCEITLCREGTNYKVHTLFSAARLSLLSQTTKSIYHMHSTRTVMFWKVPERLMTHRLRNQHARVYYLAAIAKSIRTRHSASLTC
jgi:hypothetical protein